MPESWKTVPINAGLLVALATGVAATLLAGYSLQSWVDARIDDQIDRRLMPINQDLDKLDRRISRQVSESIANQHLIIERLQAMDERLTTEEESN